MSTKRTTLSNPRRRALYFGLVAALAALGAGIAIGFVMRQSSIDSLEQTNALQVSRIARAESDLASSSLSIEDQARTTQSLKEAIAALEADRRNLDSRVEALDRDLEDAQNEVSRLGDLERRQAKVLDLGLLKDQLDADRLLLVEMRREGPNTKDEAERLWSNIRNLAQRSENSLGSKVDAVTRALPAYYNWQSRAQAGDFATDNEAFLTYQLVGADVFEASINKFWRAFQLVLIDRVGVISSLAGGS
jgi:septal ring factor EnvC (AmiA/AmiB activator)